MTDEARAMIESLLAAESQSNAEYLRAIGRYIEIKLREILPIVRIGIVEETVGAEAEVVRAIGRCPGERDREIGHLARHGDGNRVKAELRMGQNKTNPCTPNAPRPDSCVQARVVVKE